MLAIGCGRHTLHIMAGHRASKTRVNALMSRPSTSCLRQSKERKTWMPGTRPGMTNREACALRRRSAPLLLQFLARLDIGAPEVNARRMVDRPLANHLGEQEVGQPLDLVGRQRRWRIGHLETARAQVGLLEAEAASVTVGQAIEGRHAGAGPAAFDGLDQNLAVERDLPQVRPVGHLAVHLAAIGRPAMTGLAVALLQKELAAGGDVLRGLREGS